MLFPPLPPLSLCLLSSAAGSIGGPNHPGHHQQRHCFRDHRRIRGRCRRRRRRAQSKPGGKQRVHAATPRDSPGFLPQLNPPFANPPNPATYTAGTIYNYFTYVDVGNGGFQRVIRTLTPSPSRPPWSATALSARGISRGRPGKPSPGPRRITWAATASSWTTRSPSRPVRAWVICALFSIWTRTSSPTIHRRTSSCPGGRWPPIISCCSRSTSFIGSGSARAAPTRPTRPTAAQPHQPPECDVPRLGGRLLPQPANQHHQHSRDPGLRLHRDSWCQHQHHRDRSAGIDGPDPPPDRVRLQRGD